MIYHYKCKICNHKQESNDSLAVIHICDNCGHVDIPLEFIDSANVHVAYKLTIFEKELDRRRKNEPIGIVYKWLQRNAQYINLHEMNTTHLHNTIKMLKRKLK